jgi:enterochelin esterase-like enzyme
LYAALNWPQRFGCVLSQSGSFWWPTRDGQQDGLIIEQLKRGELTAQGLRIVLEAGVREPLIFGPIRPCMPNYNIHSRRFSGVRLTADMMRFAGAAG